MLLSTRLFIESSISDELLLTIIAKLVKASIKDESILKSLFDFLLIIWQRRPSNIRKGVLEFLEDNTQFHRYLANFKCSLWMILVDLISRWSNGECFPILIETIGLKIKKDEFYILYGEQLLSRLFSEFENIVSTAQSDFIIKFFKDNFQYETGVFFNTKHISNDAVKKALSMILPKQSTKFSKTGDLQVNISTIPKQKAIDRPI